MFIKKKDNFIFEDRNMSIKRVKDILGLRPSLWT